MTPDERSAFQADVDAKVKAFLAPFDRHKELSDRVDALEERIRALESRETA